MTEQDTQSIEYDLIISTKHGYMRLVSDAASGNATTEQQRDFERALLKLAAAVADGTITRAQLEQKS